MLMLSAAFQRVNKTNIGMTDRLFHELEEDMPVAGFPTGQYVYDLLELIEPQDKPGITVRPSPQLPGDDLGGPFRSAAPFVGDIKDIGATDVQPGLFYDRIKDRRDHRSLAPAGVMKIFRPDGRHIVASTVLRGGKTSQ